MAEASYSAPVYGSPDYFNYISKTYQDTMAPQLAQAKAQVYNTLGGKGAASGSVLPNIYAQQVTQPYMAGLQGVMGNAVTDASKFYSQKPFQEAALTGKYNGQSTLPYLEYKTPYDQQTAYQAESTGILKDTATAQALQAIFTALQSSGVLGSLGGTLGGVANNLVGGGSDGDWWTQY